MTEQSQPAQIEVDGSIQTVEKLASTLDDLLERYLNLIHQYQMLQGGLSEHLAAVGRMHCGYG